jgi:hypothetical protein
MYRCTTLYSRTCKYKNKICREIHHLVNAHAIKTTSDTSRMMRLQRHNDAYYSPLQNKSENQEDFQTRHPEFKVDILHQMLTTHRKH